MEWISDTEIFYSMFAGNLFLFFYLYSPSLSHDKLSINMIQWEGLQQGILVKYVRKKQNKTWDFCAQE